MPYRQCEIYARQGLELDRSTVCDWVGQAAWLLDPIVAAIRAHVFAADKIHGDNRTVRVLSPGLGRSKTGRLWAFVRDDRPFCGGAPPAVACFYSPGRTSAHPAPPPIHANSKLDILQHPRESIPGELAALISRGARTSRAWREIIENLRPAVLRQGFFQSLHAKIGVHGV